MPKIQRRVKKRSQGVGRANFGRALPQNWFGRGQRPLPLDFFLPVLNLRQFSKGYGLRLSVIWGGRAGNARATPVALCDTFPRGTLWLLFARPFYYERHEARPPQRASPPPISLFLPTPSAAHSLGRPLPHAQKAFDNSPCMGLHCIHE